MKKYSAFIICSFLILCMIPAFASAQTYRGNDRVCVYKDNHFNGRERCYRPGDEISDIRSAQISSIRVYGRARAIIYEDRGFRGRVAEFTGNVPDLARVSMTGSVSWNDRIGSMRVTDATGRYDRDRNDRSSGRYGYPPPPSPQYIQQGVCVYEKANYQGRSQCWSSAMNLPDLGRSNWSDRIRSVRVYGSARVIAYRDINYQGERVIIDRDTPDLNRLPMRAAGDWDRQISSLQIESGRNYGGRRNRNR
jgi:Peptidase inhibitor family I36